MEGLKGQRWPQFAVFFLGAFLAVKDVYPDPSSSLKKLLYVAYYKNTFGHLHKNPSRYSQSLSTISCGHPFKVYALVNPDNKSERSLFEKYFRYVKAGPYEGYIDKRHLSFHKEACFQNQFPVFFENLNLTLTDMYYWGKLYDQYRYGKSKVK